ncbi:uncharacterized protein BDR25DRAFT_86848, partial [Lindgomyces ingoldianus]
MGFKALEFSFTHYIYVCVFVFVCLFVLGFFLPDLSRLFSSMENIPKKRKSCYRLRQQSESNEKKRRYARNISTRRVGPRIEPSKPVGCGHWHGRNSGYLPKLPYRTNHNVSRAPCQYFCSVSGKMKSSFTVKGEWELVAAEK